MGRTIGIDADMKALFIREIYPDNTWKEYEIPFTEKGLRAFESRLEPDDRIAVEATLNSYYLYDRFKNKAAEVVIANPMKLRLITRSDAKSDRNDAGKIATLFHVGYLPMVWVPAGEIRQDREILQHRYATIRDRTRIKNRIRSLLAKHGLVCPSTDIQNKDAQVFMQRVLVRLPWTAREKLESLLRQLNVTEQEIKRADQIIETRADRYPDVDLLMTIPGVGTLTALAIRTIIGDITRFMKAGSLANYAGMVPRQRASGKHSWSGSVTKAGSKVLRWAVNEVIHSLIRQPGSFQKFYRRLARHKRKGVAITACGRKLLEVIWHMLTYAVPFRDINPKLNNRKQQKRKMRPRARKTSLSETLPTIKKHLGTLRELAVSSSSDSLIPREFLTLKGEKQIMIPGALAG